jgi:hypothetical protein
MWLACTACASSAWQRSNRGIIIMHVYVDVDVDVDVDIDVDIDVDVVVDVDVDVDVDIVVNVDDFFVCLSVSAFASVSTCPTRFLSSIDKTISP